MAGRGPAPKEHRQRERDTRRREADTTTVENDGVLRGPNLIDATGRADWHPMTLSWFDDWRQAPQAVLFEGTDWRRLLMLAPMVDYYHTSPKPSAAAMSEIRLNEERLGALYVDRQRAKIRVENDADKAPAEVVQLRAVSRDDAMARLRGAK